MITMIGLLHDRGIDIGSEMSVISFDDIAVFRLLTPQVAIISRKLRIWVARAWIVARHDYK